MRSILCTVTLIRFRRVKEEKSGILYNLRYMYKHAQELHTCASGRLVGASARAQRGKVGATRWAAHGEDIAAASGLLTALVSAAR